MLILKEEVREAIKYVTNGKFDLGVASMYDIFVLAEACEDGFCCTILHRR